MDEDKKRIDVKEFREFGYLQELNRLFLHPLGLALEVIVDDESESEIINGIWDCRDDPEGIIFHDSVLKKESFKEKKERVQKEMSKRHEYRAKKLGFITQE